MIDTLAIIRQVPAEALGTEELSVVSDLVVENFGDTATTAAPAPYDTAHLISLLRTACPDVQYDVEDEITVGNQMVRRSRATGTHQRELFGVAPTGRQLTWSEIDIVWFAGDRITRHCGVVNQTAILDQLRASATV